MAGLYLASLFTSDRNRYKSIIQTVTGKKEEFRYMLYFAVSQNRELGRDVVNLISKFRKEHQHHHYLSGLADPEHFLVDVTLECHDTAVAEVVRTTMLNNKRELTISSDENAHTVAGYMFILNDLVQ